MRMYISDTVAAAKAMRNISEQARAGIEIRRKIEPLNPQSVKSTFYTSDHTEKRLARFSSEQNEFI